MYARIPVVLAFLFLFILAGAMHSEAALSAADRVHEVTLAQGPSERAQSVSDAAPVLIAPAPMRLRQGATADQTLFASDDDGDPIWFSKTFGPAYMTVTTLNAGSGSATGNVHLAPTLADQGTEIGGIKASDGALSDSLTLEITVTPVTPNRSPVLDQPSPMSGRAGETIDQTLTATDPDLNPLIAFKLSGPAYMSVQTLNASGSAATGLVHLSTTGSDAGSCTGTVGASDGVLIDQKSFSIEIRASTVPQIFLSNSDRTVRLASGRPTWCVRVELDSGHSAADVVLTSLVVKYAGGEARALAGSTKVDGDQDRNGIEEIEACFSKGDLRSLFAGLPSGHNSVTVAVEGDLIDGTGFAGDIAVDVVAGSGPASASVNPNPFNPRANLTFATSVPGQLRVKLYSLTGHLLRTLVDETAARAGYHDVTVDGLDDRGARLPSGIYFYKIETAEGVFTGRIAILM